MRVFIGADPRQQIAVQVLAHSIFWRSSRPVEITPLILAQLPIKRRGLTEFTFSRYLVPHLMRYEGIALFLDADMLVLDDIADLFDMKDGTAVQVAKHNQRFEWPSMMLFDCDQCRVLTPEFIDNMGNAPQTLKWAKSIGDLPPEWNHCVGYDAPAPAKLAHFTKGIPCWPETKDCEYSREWYDELGMCNSTVSHEELMGQSVHVKGAVQ